MNEHDVAAGMRAAMRRFGSTVSVITARLGHERFAMTATSLTSLSMQPPSVLVCVNQDAAIFKALAASSQFMINILTAEQHPIAAACGGKFKGDDRFLGAQWDETHARIPYLVDAQANLYCDLDARFDYGTHSIIVGRVTFVTVQEEVNPLGYLNGAYIRSHSSAAQVTGVVST